MSRKGKTDRGSVEWFLQTKRKLERHVKAVDAIAFSARAFHRLCELRESDKEDDIARDGLFSAAVITYARPFVQTQAGNTFPESVVLKGQGCSKNLHIHLIKLRNKIIAHADDDYVDCRIVYDFNQISGPVSFRLLRQASVVSHTISSVDDKSLLTALQNHVDAAMRATLKHVTEALSDYLRAANEFSENFTTSRTAEQEASIKWGEPFKVSVEPVPIPQTIPNPSDWLKKPIFEVHSDGYRYRAITVAVSMGPARIDFTTPESGKGSIFISSPEQISEKIDKLQNEWKAEATDRLPSEKSST